MRKEKFVTGEIYHIVTRGVGDTEIFRDIDDHYRGIFSLYEFNTNKSVEIRERRQHRRALKAALKKAEARGGANGSQTSVAVAVADEREILVEILAFCFVPNHIHLLLRQVADNGIVRFMQKAGTGYAKYFNKKYERKGHLFGRFHAVHIRDEIQLKTVFVYIHCNSLSLIEPGWKEKGIKNPKEAIKFLENYKWSSYPDYLGKKNFPSVTERDFLTNIMGGEDGCRNWVESWVRYKKELKDWYKLGIE